MSVATHHSSPGRAGSGQGRAGRTPAIVLGLLAVAAGIAFNPWTVALAFSPDGSIEHPLILGTIAAAGLTSIALGLYLLIARPRIGAAELAVLGVSSLICLAGAELVMRWVYRADDLWFATLRRSSVTGWETRENFHVTRDLGAYGVVTYSTVDDGFRRRGPDVSTRARVLVLGDSYTEASQVSDGGTYYDFLADSTALGLDVFAYGASAYGTLQQYLILEREIERVAPDLILWQWCSNDLFNNSRALEARSLYENSGWRRPYLEHGEIVMRAPSERWIVQHSRIAQFLEARRRIALVGQVASGRSHHRSIELDLTPDHPLVLDATETTVEIVRRARQRAGGIPIVAFVVDDPPWLGDAFERVAREADVRLIRGIPAAVDSERQRGRQVDGITDAHWNATGHGIAARLIADSLSAWRLPAGRQTRLPHAAGEGQGAGPS